MSLALRALMRDPYLVRPLSRLARRLDGDLDHWQPKRARLERYVSPVYDSPLNIMADMNRQMNEAVEMMHEFARDLDEIDSLTRRYDKGDNLERRRRDELTRTESGGLQLALDVAGFKPEDLKIKLVDGDLIVEASTESSGKDSYNKNHYKRWFRLPEDCNLEEIKSKLTPDNRLVIDLPSNKAEETHSRTIPIEMERPKESQAVSEGTGQSTSQSSDSNPTKAK